MSSCRFSISAGTIQAGYICLLSWFAPDPAQAQVTPEQILNYKPTQADVEIDTPAGADVAKCKLDVEREGKATGYLLLDSQGLPLRRFMDMDASGKIDHFQYFRHGLEVYRDYDSDGDEKTDQFRWLNTAGSRWGMDTNADGKIDQWKRISAEEATREAIRAMSSGDEPALQAVLMTATDARDLGLSKEAAEKLLDSVGEASKKMRAAITGSKVLTSRSRWVRFDTSMLMPNLIPAGSGKSSQDVLVYENVMAIVEVGGENGFVQIGEMVRVGDVWKLTQIPRPVEGDQFVADGGILLQPSMTSAAAGATGGLSAEVQKLLEDLKSLDDGAQSAQASAETLTRYNLQRAQLLAKLAGAVDTDEDRGLWMKQLLEHISAATQMGAYPKGAEQLLSYEQQLRRSKASPDLVGFATWQRKLADYYSALQTAAQADRSKVQEEWLKSLEAYVKEFPQAENAADALLQVALTHEINGGAADLRQAEAAYSRVAKEFPASKPADRARGALRRMNLKGQKLELAGQALGGTGKIDLAAYKGRAVLVLYWTTTCEPCLADLPQIQELYKTYQKNGFEVVGVCLDPPGDHIQKHIQQYKIPWPHIHEPGDVNSRPSIELGIASLPTMILTDKSGTVVLTSATVDDLKKQLPLVLK